MCLLGHIERIPAPKQVSINCHSQTFTETWPNISLEHLKILFVDVFQLSYEIEETDNDKARALNVDA